MKATRSIAQFLTCASITAVALLASIHIEAAPPVQVTAADPSSAPQGTVSLDVAVSGNGFDSSADVSFLVTGTADPGGIAVKKVVVSGSKKLTATIDIADTAAVAQFDIEVRLSGGRKGKGTTLFAVQKAGSATAINPAFALDPNQQYKDKVARLDANGTGITTLSGPLIWSPQPRWSPDGRSIFYFDRLPMLFVKIDSRSGGIQGTLPVETNGLPDGHDWSNGGIGTCGDLIVYSGARDLDESDLFVASPDLSQTKKLIMSHDTDDATVGNEGDPNLYNPAWSSDGRYIAAYSRRTTESGSVVKSLILYSIACSSGVDAIVSGEIELTLSVGTAATSWGGFSWSATGRYLAMTVHETADANLWIADLGDPSQPGYPNAVPSMYRLTGANRPFGGGAERVMSTSFAPSTDTIAIVTQATQRDRDDSLYTINAGACIAAIGGMGSISTACAATLVSRGINAYNVDWRPNWPTPLM